MWLYHEKLQAAIKADPSAVLKQFGFDVEDLPSEVAAAFTGAGEDVVREVGASRPYGGGSVFDEPDCLPSEPATWDAGSPVEKVIRD